MKRTELLNGVGITLFACSMGKVFRVTHVCPDAESANRAMEQDSTTALIAEDRNGFCYLAEQYGATAPSAILDEHKRQISTQKRI